MRVSWEKAVLMVMLFGALLVCAEPQDDTDREVVFIWEEEGYNCYPPWHQHCQTSGSAILRRRTGGKLVRRRPLPVWEFDTSAEDPDRLPDLAGDLQEWLSDGTFTLPRETDSDGSVRRQILDRLAGSKIRSQRANSEQ